MNDNEKCGHFRACKHAEGHRSEKLKKSLDQRLSKIEGQVRGLKKMIDSEIYCKDLIIQITAVEAALAAVRNVVLEDHLKCCVKTGIVSGDSEILEEVMDMIRRISR